MTEELEKLTGRYVALWNEPGADRRREMIEELWAPGGSNYTTSMKAVGYDELEARVTRAFDSYVGSGAYHFRTAVPPVEHHGAVKVHWEMVRTDDREVASVGLEFLVLDDAGRIVSDHQFLIG